MFVIIASTEDVRGGEAFAGGGKGKQICLHGKLRIRYIYIYISISIFIFIFIYYLTAPALFR